MCAASVLTATACNVCIILDTVSNVRSFSSLQTLESSFHTKLYQSLISSLSLTDRERHAEKLKTSDSCSIQLAHNEDYPK